LGERPNEICLRTEPTTAEDTSRIAALWNACIGDEFPMTDRLLAQNWLGDFMRPASGSLCVRERGEIVGWVLFKANDTVPPILQKYRLRGGIGALCVSPSHRGKGIGSNLLRVAEEALAAAGCESCHLQYFPFHFLPGVPMVARDLVAFLETRGFGEFRECYDFIRDVKDFDCPSDPRIRPLSAAEASSCLAFVEREFPGGWHFSTKRHFEAGGAPEDIVVAIDRGEIIGFCHTFTKDSPLLGGSTHWYLLLGAHYGGLGPIGIAKERRGEGIGIALLMESVLHNKRRGVRNMVIDWTTLDGFYGKAGFTKWKTYLQGSKRLTQ
jgi:GNAT superfamily N-acetyltransferase